jgi:hypothetical protein
MLGRVEELEADVVARLDAEPRIEGMRQLGGALVELPVRESAVAADHRLPLGDSVGDALEQVGDVEGEYLRSLPWPT